MGKIIIDTINAHLHFLPTTVTYNFTCIMKWDVTGGKHEEVYRFRDKILMDHLATNITTFESYTNVDVGAKTNGERDCTFKFCTTFEDKADLDTIIGASNLESTAYDTVTT